MMEIQGKSSLVRVRARFELARVRVIRSRLYFFRVKGHKMRYALTQMDYCHSELQMYKAEFESLFTCDDPTDYQ